MRNPEHRRHALLRRMLQDADTVQRQPLLVCDEQRPLETVADARYVGAAIFEYYTRMSASTRTPVPAEAPQPPPPSEVDIEQLEDFFVSEEALLTKLSAIFDPSKKRKCVMVTGRAKKVDGKMLMCDVPHLNSYVLQVVKIGHCRWLRPHFPGPQELGQQLDGFGLYFASHRHLPHQCAICAAISDADCRL